MNAGFSYPILSVDEYNRLSPFTLNDYFANWLFNDNIVGQTDISPDLPGLTPVASYSDKIALKTA